MPLDRGRTGPAMCMSPFHGQKGSIPVSHGTGAKSPVAGEAGWGQVSRGEITAFYVEFLACET